MFVKKIKCGEEEESIVIMGPIVPFNTYVKQNKNKPP